MNVEDNDRDLLLVSIFTFLTVFSWVFFQLVKTIKTTTVSQPVQEVTKPLNPTLDTAILDVLEKKKTYR